MTKQFLAAAFGKSPLVIAHRGARDVAPENTMAAFEAAREAGADGIELDVQFCATGEVVVLHDDSVDRTTDGSGKCSELSWGRIRSLDAGSWFDDRFSGQGIPSLAEVLDWLPTGMLLNVEIKSSSLRVSRLATRVGKMITARDMQQQTLISSFNPLALWYVARRFPDLATALLYAPDMSLPLRRAWARAFLPLEALHPHHSLVNEAYVSRWHRRGLRINPWTVNEETKMQELIALGVDAIITDHPGHLRALIHAQNR